MRKTQRQPTIAQWTQTGWDRKIVVEHCIDTECGAVTVAQLCEAKYCTLRCCWPWENEQLSEE